ncbi:MAG TPA: TetR/AcrR family transcriptional regulator [Thermoplasmata archaeon]|nr:TetR/AcrR family transcriptional regulator [Thermoplasmata archaeon]
MVRISAAAKDAVRQRLLEAAAAQFAHQGFDATNIDDIAVAAGVAKGTIYNYFESKEDLFGGVLAEGALRTVHRYSSLPHGTSTRSALRALAAADVTVLQEEEAFMKVLVAEAMTPRSRNYSLILGRLSPFLAAVAEILESGVRTGDIRRDRPVPQLVLFFVGILALLYIQHWQSDGSWPRMEEIPDLAVDTFLDGARERGREARRHSKAVRR